MTDLFGYIAAGFTTLSFLPQVIQVWRTRSARDLSLPMYLMFLAGVVCWLTYGLLLGAWPIILANTVTLTLAGSVLVMKLIFDRR